MQMLRILSKALTAYPKYGYSRHESSRQFLRMSHTLSEVTASAANGVRRITLSNPKTRNSLSYNMLSELLTAVNDPDPHLRCIVLTAEGNVFSAGHNLKELSADAGRAHHEQVFELCSKLMITLQRLPVPVIAQVNGIAAAAGCQLVCSCDIIVASDKSSFVTPGASVGIFCSTPGIALARSVPRKVCTDMLLTGLPLDARKALEVGLISAVVPEDKLEAETEKRISAILSKSKAVIALGKKFMYEQMDMRLEDAYKAGSKIMVDNIDLKDGQEGIRSFMEKRKPNWSHTNEPNKAV